MLQFCTLFYGNYTILATQRGGMAPWPLLNMPPGLLFYEKMLKETFGFVVIIFIMGVISIWGADLDLAPLATPWKK